MKIFDKKKIFFTEKNIFEGKEYFRQKKQLFGKIKLLIEQEIF